MVSRKILTQILVFLIFFSFLGFSEINLSQSTSADIHQSISRSRTWVTSALKWLRVWQNEDGGWGQHPLEKSDPRYTAWAMNALIDAGYPIDSSELKKASDSLINTPWPEYALHIMLRPLVQMGEIHSQETIEAISKLEENFFEQNQKKHLDDLSFNNYALTLALAGRARTIPADLSWIVDLQNDDGSFGITQYIGDSAIEYRARYTSWAIVSLSLFAGRNETYTFVISKATEFLMANQNEDGSWGDVGKYSQYAGLASEWLFSTLSVLYSLLFTQDSTADSIQKAIGWVVENQPPSGIQESTLNVAQAVCVVASALSVDIETAKAFGLNGLKVFQTSDGDFVEMMDHKLTNEWWETLDLTVLALDALISIEENPYSLSVTKAKNWLLKRQSAEGFWEYNYSKPLYFNFFGYPGTPPTDDLSRIMHTSRVIDVLLRTGSNPAENALAKSKDWIKRKFDRNIDNWVGMSSDLCEAIMEGVIALIDLGEEIDSLPIQKALSIFESQIMLETTDMKAEALDFFLRTGEDSESIVVQSLVTHLIDSQEPEGRWRSGYTQHGYSIYHDFFLTLKVLNSIKRANVNYATASLGSATTWLNETWVENNTLHSFIAENDFTYHIYSLSENLKIFNFLNDTDAIAKTLETILVEQNTPANIARKIKMQKIDFFPPYDRGWPSYFSNSSSSFYEKVASTPEATVEALRILESSGISDNRLRPLTSFLIDFPERIRVGESYIGTASIYPVSEQIVSLEVKAQDSYVYPETQDILLSRHTERNVSLYITPLRDGQINLEVRLFCEDECIGLRVMRIQAYFPPFTVLDFIYKWGPVLGFISATISIAGLTWKAYKWRRSKADTKKKRRPKRKRSKQ